MNETLDWVLKVIVVIIGAIATVLCLRYSPDYFPLTYAAIIFFTISFLILYSDICGSNNDDLYEGIYHLFGFLVLLGVGIYTAVTEGQEDKMKKNLFAASILEIINSLFYLHLAIRAFNAKDAVPPPPPPAEETK